MSKAKTKTIETLEHGDCRWPIGDPRHADFHFCGAQSVLGRPYCTEHWQQSFDVTKSRSASTSAALTKPLLAIRRAA